MNLKVQRLTNPLSIRFLRRDIARVKTALSSQNNSYFFSKRSKNEN